MSVWRLLERPSLRPVWKSVHEALEKNPEARSALLKSLDLEARGDLQGLLGLPSRPPERYRLKLGQLEASLQRAEDGLTARQVVETLVGPVVDRKVARAEAREREESMWAAARARAPDRLHPWLEDLRQKGRIKAAATKTGRSQQTLLDDALACACQLPADGKLLQVLASEQTGDPHALDGNRNLASLVLRAAASLVGWEDWPRTAAQRRALWAEVGILTDSLSSHVLVHGLRPVGLGALATQLRDQAQRGLARKITLAELQQEPISLPAGTRVYLIENPSILDEAARRHGPECAPVVCLDGEPTVAVWELLSQLRNCELVFHCDYDAAGVRIANRVFHRVGAQPHSFDASQYRTAAARKRKSVALEGRVINTPWDPGLAEAMRELRAEVFEEDLVEALVGSLRQHPHEENDTDLPF